MQEIAIYLSERKCYKTFEAEGGLVLTRAQKQAVALATKFFANSAYRSPIQWIFHDKRLDPHKIVLQVPDGNVSTHSYFGALSKTMGADQLSSKYGNPCKPEKNRFKTFANLIF